MTKKKTETEQALGALVEPTKAHTALRASYVKRIKAAMGRTVEGIIEVAQQLVKAKAELEHGQFTDMVENDLHIGERNAQKLMEIARNPHLTNPSNLTVLPSTWTTLYELTKVPEHRLEALIEKGKITPHITGKEVKDLQPAKKKKTRTETVEDDPEEETTPVSNPGFYTGLGGGGSDEKPMKTCPHCNGTGKVPFKGA